MPNRESSIERVDNMIKENPTYAAHIAANGKPELIEDPQEAYEVAHGTKHLEESYAQDLGHLARYYETGVVRAGYADPESDKGKVEQHQMAVEDFNETLALRTNTDKLGARISEAYKNGAEFLDLSSDEFTEAFQAAPIYRKSTKVSARPAEVGELVVTTTPDGVEEGRNTAGENDFVVTGANGADFILPTEKFNKLYGATENEGEYQAKGMARIIDNPTGKKIGILAPWGEMQYGDAEAKLAVQYDPEKPEVIGSDRYVLDSNEFAVYKPVES